LVPALGIGSRKASEGIAKVGERFSRTAAAAKLDKIMGSNLAKVAEEGIEALPNRRRIFDPVKEFYTKAVGEPLKMGVFNNGAELLGGGAGAYIGSEVGGNINGADAQMSRLETRFADGLISPEEYNADKDYIINNEEKMERDARFLGLISGFALGAGSVVGVKWAAPEFSQRVARGFVDNYGLDPDYVKAKEQSKAFGGHIAQQMLDLHSMASTLDEKQSRVLNELLQGTRGGKFSPAVVMEMDEKVMDAFLPIMQRAVDYGMVSPKTFQGQAQALLDSIIDDVNVHKDPNIAHFLRGLVKQKATEDAFIEQSGAMRGLLTNAMDQLNPSGQKLLESGGYKRIRKLLELTESLEDRRLVMHIKPTNKQKFLDNGWEIWAHQALIVVRLLFVRS
jgi:hypothetical protein